jgi:hypothetical protein
LTGRVENKRGERKRGMKKRRRSTRRRFFTFSLQAGEGKKRKLRKLRQKPRRYQ